MGSETDDFQLMRRTAKGDRAALSALFARHYTRVFRFAARMVNSEPLAEEIANEVFMEIWQHADRFEGQSSVSTYCLAIARFKALSHMRRRREVAVDDEQMMALVDDADTPEVAAQVRSKAVALRAAVDALPEEFRSVIDLSYYHEMSLKEIATVLSIPPETVKTRIFRARKRLVNLLQDAGIDRGWP